MLVPRETQARVVRPTTNDIGLPGCNILHAAWIETCSRIRKNAGFGRTEPAFLRMRLPGFGSFLPV